MARNFKVLLQKKMKIINYIIAVLLIVLWVVGFFAHVAGLAVHTLLAGAFLLILLNVIDGDRGNTPENI